MVKCLQVYRGTAPAPGMTSIGSATPRVFLTPPKSRKKYRRINAGTSRRSTCTTASAATCMTRGSGLASRRVPRKTQTSSYGLPPRPRLAIPPDLRPERLAPREQLRGFFLLCLFRGSRRRRALLGQDPIQCSRINFVDQRPQLISGIDGSRPPPT